MPSVKAMVFDVDGTLLDTRKLIIETYGHVATVHNLQPVTHTEIMQHMGKSLGEIYQALFPGQDAQLLIRTNNKYVLENMHTTRPHQGLIELLQSLRSKRIKLAVLTGGTHKVHEVLRQHGIEELFDSIVHSERLEHQKPHPEGLLLALKECGVAPGQAVMVGDMRFDIQAGKNAAVLATVGMTYGFGTLEELKKAGADYIVDSLELLEDIITRIEQE